MTRRTRLIGWFLWCLAIATLAWPAAAEAQSDTVVYYYTDAVGTVRMTTDGNGTVLARYDDPPFGAPSASPPPPVEPRRFAGKERDAETGLDYFGARYYSNQTGRFTTVDPVLNIEPALFNPQRWNRYGYAGNNPLRFVDPDGADFWDFVNGVGDAIRANLALGVGRSDAGNSDFRTGQTVGDIASLLISAYQFTEGTAAASGGVVLCGSGVGCSIGAPTAAAGVAVSGHAVGVGMAAGVSLMSAAGDGSGAKSINQMNQEVKRGQAPDGIARVDRGKVKGEQDNVHFSNGASLNRDGTWKHGSAKLTRVQEEWLRVNGWTIPE